MNSTKVNAQRKFNSKMKQAHDRIYELQMLMEEMELREEIGWTDMRDADQLVEGLDGVIAKTN